MSPSVRAYDEYFGHEPLVEMIRDARRIRFEREANLGYAAICIAPTVLVAQALYRGRQVPREALKPEFRDRLVCWDGFLTDELVTDVLVLLEADRLAGEFEPASSSDWRPKLSPRTERRAA